MVMRKHMKMGGKKLWMRTNMNTININDYVHKELIGRVLVKLEYVDENEESGRRRFYGSVINDVLLSLDESREDPVIWLYFEDGDTFAYLNESITVE